MIITAKNMLFVLAAFLVVVLGVIGYVYYSQSLILGMTDRVTTSLKKQDSSDETASIEKDLNDTEMNSIDSDLIIVETQISQ